MIKEIETTKIITVRKYYCDICQTQMDNRVTRCTQCGKMICEDCTGYIDYSTGDYDDYYCKRCWDIGAKYRTTIQGLEEQIEALEEQYREECQCK